MLELAWSATPQLRAQLLDGLCAMARSNRVSGGCFVFAPSSQGFAFPSLEVLVMSMPPSLSRSARNEYASLPLSWNSRKEYASLSRAVEPRVCLPLSLSLDI